MSPENASLGTIHAQSEKIPAPEAVETQIQGPIDVTIQEAILLALSHNKSLALERPNPAIRQASVEQERAAFDPTVNTGTSSLRQRNKDGTSNSRDYSTGIEVEVSQSLPTGTSPSAGISTNRNWSDLDSDEYSTGVDVSVTQALLRGRSPTANLASLRQAKLDVITSQYELRGFAESLVAEVEKTYWDYTLAERQTAIYHESLKLAEQQLSETREMVKIGKLAEAEITAARAQVALRKEDLIKSRSNLEKTRLGLLRLLNPPGVNLWNREVSLKDLPAVPDAKLDDIEVHVQVAMQMRPDLNQARLSIQRGDLEVVKTKNGLLPQLDLFISLGRTGYAESFHDSTEDINSGSYNYTAGLTFEFPLGNRAAKARNRQAVLSAGQLRESLENLEQLVILDVRSAYVEVKHTREQIAATTATRTLQDELLRIETEKYRLGKSTSYLVAQVQRDLVASEVSEIQAVVSYLKALVDLFRLEGSLLERRGISTSGPNRYSEFLLQ